MFRMGLYSYRQTCASLISQVSFQGTYYYYYRYKTKLYQCSKLSLDLIKNRFVLAIKCNKWLKSDCLIIGEEVLFLAIRNSGRQHILKRERSVTSLMFATQSDLCGPIIIYPVSLSQMS